MRSTLRTLAVLALTLSLALAVAACGSDNSGGGSSTKQSSGGGNAAAGKAGGVANTDLTSYPDYMDPALSYTQEGWQSLWTVYTGLLTYNHKEGAEGAQLIPGLAEAMPKVTNGGKTYTLKLRQGLKYSDGTPVKASDFAHTIKRVLHLESGGSSFYLGIVGAEQYLKAGKADGDISGIKTNDQTGEITINIKEPAGWFPYVLAMDFAGIVPGDTPMKNVSKNPPAGVGPFKLEDVRQNRGFSLVRNDAFPDIPNIPKPKLDKVTVTVVKDQSRQTQDILSNKVDYALDPPPADQLRNVKAQAKDRYEEFVTNSTYYYFLNNRVAPFNNVKARQAVAYAIDKGALRRLFAGLLQPDCNFLPPGMEGYKKLDPCPYGDPNSPPNIEKAKQLVQESGLAGSKVTVWGDDEDPSTPVANYLADVLNKIGFKAKPKIVEGSVYFQTIGNQKTNAQAGFANWFQDFPHPRNFMFLVDPASIQQTNNQNYSNVDDPQIGRMLKEANAKPIDQAAPEYAQVDALLAKQANVVPYGHRLLANFVSNRVDFDNCTLTHPVYELDFTQLCLK